MLTRTSPAASASAPASGSAAPSPDLAERVRADHASVIGAQSHDCPRPTAAAGAPNRCAYDPVRLDDHVTRACPDCDGVGEVELLALDATRPVLVDCDACNGSGETAPRCDCGEPVVGGDADGDGGVCHACELLFLRDGREPTDDEIYAGWAVAERYALHLNAGRGE